MIAERLSFNNLIGYSAGKVNVYFKLLKFRLSFFVVFSSGMGYLLASPVKVNWINILVLSLIGFCVTGASNILNQIIERESDKLMKRTRNRPLPSGRIAVSEALIYALVLGISGIAGMLHFFNMNAALLSSASLLLYAFAYTPLKTRSPLAVFVGAIPGALPPMIGWVAATNKFGLEPGILFAIQFFWQFPHYWAIAWVLDEDYKKANIRLLPSKGQRDINTAFRIMIYTVFLLPFGLMPMVLGMTGVTSAVIAVLCGVLFLAQTFYLMKECTDKAALQIMFGSFIYLPVVQIAFVLDKLPQ
jgi:heme o synthase